MQGLRKAASTDGEIRWFDCTRIDGTDCYCDDEAQAILRKQIEFSKTPVLRQAQGPSSISTPGIHFFDNGNYHYMSKIWTDMVQEPFSLVVFDHHPDMQAPRFGNILSCGGWVKKVLEENRFIDNVVIVGVADHLADEIREELSQAGDASFLDKATFIRESELSDTSNLKPQRRIAPTSHLYISIDKDALSPAFAATNWDQGSLDIATLKEIIADLAAGHKILGIDICGERARDFAGDERHTVQEADALNDRINRELAEFLRNL